MVGGGGGRTAAEGAVLDGLERRKDEARAR